MSASREKQSRKNGVPSPRTAMEEQQRKQERRSNLIYGCVGVLVAAAVILGIVWNSGVISRSATAVTIDGQKYTSAQTSFYYRNAYVNFMNQWYYLSSYLGLDTSSPLDSQTIDESAASTIGAEAGITWKDYFVNTGIDQMVTIQNGLKQASEEGFAFPETIQAQIEENVDSLKEAASSNGVSVSQYLKSTYGATMTERVYRAEMERILQFQAYGDAKEKGLTYSDADLEAAYKEDPNSYDQVSYESVTISYAVDDTTDADGNTVEASEEEKTAAQETARAAADRMLTDVKAGRSLETLADSVEGASYANEENSTYTGSTASEWAFDSARKSGDAEVLEDGESYIVTLFHDRSRDENKTIDVRHILIRLEDGTLTAEDEGYDAEQERLKADARAKAEAVYEQWKSGEATEASFAALAMTESDDSNKYDGGLYTKVAQGDMVAEFNDWCFDPARKSGDNGIVDTTYGSHVMYFVGDDIPAWKAAVDANLRSSDYQAWFDSLSENTEAQRSDFGMRFVG